MNASQTARQRARVELTREIKEEARRQLAAAGAPQLSLRAVARQLGMVSSALYRYFPSRDDLLTALIIDAYDALGASAEEALGQASAAGSWDRWRAVCHAVRDWALSHPHEYALIYGSPVPGYQAPRETVEPAARVPSVLGQILQDAWTASPPAPDAPHTDPPHTSPPPADPPPADPPAELSPVLAGQAAVVAAAIAPDVPGPVIVRALIAWTQLFGMISFELFGQLVGSADPSDEFFARAVQEMAVFIPLPR
ncbi:MAG: TetR/AcrR family transcriptional regulator [Actinomycetota bacterium]